MPSIPPKTPPNYGRIIIPDGDLDVARFWLRVFKLEEYVSVAMADIQARPDVSKASVPIIAEYQAGGLYFYYALILFVDSLGLSSAGGGVWFTDAEHRAEAEKRRDELADHIMTTIKERVEAGALSGITLTIESPKE